MKRFLSWLLPAPTVRYPSAASRHLHDACLTLLTFAVVLMVSFPLSILVHENNDFAMPVFILAVAVIARYTEGYLYGIIASVAAVLLVNVIFSYPYWRFNMTLVGYPLNFAAMLIVSVMISALTTQNKRQAQYQLEADMEKTRANLLRSVSHDIRTPLTAIIGSSSLLMENDRLSVDERHELIASIHQDARWLSQITENILSITKISGDRVELKHEPEVLEEIIGSAIGKFRKHHPTMPVTVRKPDEILLASVDPMLIEQVLLNLMNNAVIHGKTTTCVTIVMRQTGDDIAITVADDGQGIPESVLPHLFDGSATSTRHADAQRNMGIGLSVCRTIIAAHGGRIHADQTPQGASFTFTLPACKEI